MRPGQPSGRKNPQQPPSSNSRDSPPQEGIRQRPRFELTLAANGFDDALDNALIAERVSQLAQNAAQQARSQTERTPRTRQIIRSLIETANHFSLSALRSAVLSLHYSRYMNFAQAFEINPTFGERLPYEDFMHIIRLDSTADRQNRQGVYGQARPLEPFADVVLPIPNLNPGGALHNANNSPLPETWGPNRTTPEMRAERVQEMAQQALRTAHASADRGGPGIRTTDELIIRNSADAHMRGMASGSQQGNPVRSRTSLSPQRIAGQRMPGHHPDPPRTHHTGGLVAGTAASSPTRSGLMSRPATAPDESMNYVALYNQGPTSSSRAAEVPGAAQLQKLISASENFNVDLRAISSNDLEDVDSNTGNMELRTGSGNVGPYASRSVSGRILMAMASSEEMIVASPRYNTKLQEFEYPLVYHGSNSATRVNMRERIPRHYTGTPDQRHLSRIFNTNPVDTTIKEEEEENLVTHPNDMAPTPPTKAPSDGLTEPFRYETTSAKSDSELVKPDSVKQETGSNEESNANVEPSTFNTNDDVYNAVARVNDVADDAVETDGEVRGKMSEVRSKTSDVHPKASNSRVDELNRQSSMMSEGVAPVQEPSLSMENIFDEPSDSS